MARSPETPQASAIGDDEEVLVAAEALSGLLHVHATVVRAIDEALDEAHDTGLTGYELLLRLARLHPDGASVRYLSDQVVVSPSRVSRVVEEFVGRGLLERAVSPHDGRLCWCGSPPRAGRSWREMEATFAEALTTHFLGVLSRDEVLTLGGAIAHRLGAPNCGDLEADASAGSGR